MKKGLIKIGIGGAHLYQVSFRSSSPVRARTWTAHLGAPRNVCILVQGKQNPLQFPFVLQLDNN